MWGRAPPACTLCCRGRRAWLSRFLELTQVGGSFYAILLPPPLSRRRCTCIVVGYLFLCPLRFFPSHFSPGISYISNAVLASFPQRPQSNIKTVRKGSESLWCEKGELAATGVVALTPRDSFIHSLRVELSEPLQPAWCLLLLAYCCLVLLYSLTVKVLKN